jgi:hypothetical protein
MSQYCWLFSGLADAHPSIPLNVNDLEKAVLERGERQQTISDSEFRATLERRMLIADIFNVCGDQYSRGFYNIVVQKMPAELVRTALRKLHTSIFWPASCIYKK